MTTAHPTPSHPPHGPAKESSVPGSGEPIKIDKDLAPAVPAALAVDAGSDPGTSDTGKIDKSLD